MQTRLVVVAAAERVFKFKLNDAITTRSGSIQMQCTVRKGKKNFIHINFVALLDLMRFLDILVRKKTM